ncbi:MAG: hypothetical protein JJU02_00440 [Cryomorphaceae bacterium]|nr:hypothetical protein [Cryomorphaceae bacterium]
MRIFLILIAISIVAVSCDCNRSGAGKAFDSYTDTIFLEKENLREISTYSDSLHRTVKRIDADGNVRYEGSFGNIRNLSLPVEEHFFYDGGGKMTKRITYKYTNLDHEDPARTKQLQEELTFHSDGKAPKRSAMFSNCLGCDRNPCGEWITFDTDGTKMSGVIYDNPCN